MGVYDLLYSWFESYFSGRSQRLVLDGYEHTPHMKQAFILYRGLSSRHSSLSLLCCVLLASCAIRLSIPVCTSVVNMFKTNSDVWLSNVLISQETMDTTDFIFPVLLHVHANI